MSQQNDSATTATINRPEPQTHESRQVNATVARYFPEKGFGFAVIDGERVGGRPVEVFFHAAKARIVTGTPADYSLTHEPVTDGITVNSGRNPSRLVMEIVPGDKGLRAVAWGFVPRRRWQDGFVDDDGLRPFLNGTVSSGRGNGPFVGTEYQGILAAYRLTTDNVVLFIKDVLTRDGGDPNGEFKATGQDLISLEYSLNRSQPNRLPQGGRLTITLREDGGHRRRLTFNLPTEEAPAQ